MTGGPNPAIGGTAIGGALGADQTAAAGARGLADEQSALDKAELQDLERAQYYPHDSVVTEGSVGTDAAIPPPRRSLLDRLFRR